MVAAGGGARMRAAPRYPWPMRAAIIQLNAGDATSTATSTSRCAWWGRRPMAAPIWPCSPSCSPTTARSGGCVSWPSRSAVRSPRDSRTLPRARRCGCSEAPSASSPRAATCTTRRSCSTAPGRRSPPIARSTATTSTCPASRRSASPRCSPPARSSSHSRSRSSVSGCRSATTSASPSCIGV